MDDRSNPVEEDLGKRMREVTRAMFPEPVPPLEPVMRRGRARRRVRVATVGFVAVLVAASLGWGALSLAGLHRPKPVSPPPVGNGEIVFPAYPPGYEPPRGPSAGFTRPLDLYAWTPESGARRITTGLQTDVDPVFSPDGRMLAFTRLYGRFAGYTVYVMNADGLNIHPLQTCRYSECATSPSWFPDSKHLVIWRTGSIWRVDADGTEAHMLLHFGPGWAIGSVSLSPDGSHIAFSRLPSGSGWPVLVVMNADGTNQRVLAACSATPCRGLGGIQHFSWSPDGRSLAFEDGRNVWTVQADGGGLHQLTSCAEVNGPPQTVRCQAQRPAFSPDGAWIAYANLRTIEVMRADGSRAHRLAGCDPSPDVATLTIRCRASSPVWSPDGREVAFVLQYADQTFQLKVTDLAGHIVASVASSGVRTLAWQSTQSR